MHISLSLEDQYVMLFDKIMKYLDNLGYKCVYNVRLKPEIKLPWEQSEKFNYDTNEYCSVHYVVRCLFIKKDDSIHSKTVPLSNDTYSLCCEKLNQFLNENRVFKQCVKDIDTLSSEYYYDANSHLHEMFEKLKIPKKLFYSLFIPDILNYGIVIRDIYTHVITQTIIRQKSSVEEALLNLDLLIA